MPAQIDGRPVRDIGSGAFALSPNLRQVSVSEGIQGSGEYAFAVCGSLEAVYLPASVTRVADSAFASCPETLVVVTVGDPSAVVPEATEAPSFEVAGETEETPVPVETETPEPIRLLRGRYWG